MVIIQNVSWRRCCFFVGMVSSLANLVQNLIWCWKQLTKRLDSAFLPDLFPSEGFLRERDTQQIISLHFDLFYSSCRRMVWCSCVHPLCKQTHVLRVLLHSCASILDAAKHIFKAVFRCCWPSCQRKCYCTQFRIVMIPIDWDSMNEQLPNNHPVVGTNVFQEPPQRRLFMRLPRNLFQGKDSTT